MTDEILEATPTGYFLGVRFSDTGKSYYFETPFPDFDIGTSVIVETIRGLELGQVSMLPVSLSRYQGNLSLKPILRKATPSDIEAFDENKRQSQYAYKYCTEQIERLGLGMHLVSAEFTLDRSKLIFSYLSEERVDFRDLLRLLAGHFHTRIDLRQIGSRDKAKMIGGIGICGLPLCCATFLNEFDNISINRAKNQLLTLNIPKLSGHCGKLICCLKYEDEAYTELKKDFPKVGSRVTYEGETYRITSMNVLTRIVKLENYNGVHFLPLEQVNQLPKVAGEQKGK
ncbi:MAG TPA: stage 0 sporulation protein [Firmicutes bacterium]|nr:stage 0 sporulation protein [Bacillota bacterium]